MASLPPTDSATVRVDKATSELLFGPDWTLNIDICDSINTDHGLAKDVIKSVKRRLQNKNPKVQYLALVLLETLMKNCGDAVHFQVIDRDVLHEMNKIVRKRGDVQVRDKILMLIDSWQEAFGGPSGQYPQYFHTYEELKSLGIEFPQRSPNDVPVFTPPVSHHPTPVPMLPQAAYGVPANSLRLDEVMASDPSNMSLSDFERIQSAAELLNEMLKAVNPSDQEAIKDEVITELADQCRSDQEKIMQLINVIRDEELLEQALDLNDKLQSLLTKRDALASGYVLPPDSLHVEAESSAAASAIVPPALKPLATGDFGDEGEDEEDDEFTKLARRNSRLKAAYTENSSPSPSDGQTSFIADNGGPSSPSKALALAVSDAPSHVRTTEQDMIDLLSLTISADPLPSHTMVTPPSNPEQPVHAPVHASTSSHVLSPYNNYVTPWAPTQPLVATDPFPNQNPFLPSSSQDVSTGFASRGAAPSPLSEIPKMNVNQRQAGFVGAGKASYVSADKVLDDLLENSAASGLETGGGGASRR